MLLLKTNREAQSLAMRNPDVYHKVTTLILNSRKCICVCAAWVWSVLTKMSHVFIFFPFRCRNPIKSAKMHGLFFMYGGAIIQVILKISSLLHTAVPED